MLPLAGALPEPRGLCSTPSELGTDSQRLSEPGQGTMDCSQGSGEQDEGDTTSIPHPGPSSGHVCIPGVPRGESGVAGDGGTIQSLSGVLRLPEHFSPPAADAESN